MRDSFSRNTGTNLCWSIASRTSSAACSSRSFSNRAPVASATNLVLVGYTPTNIPLTGTDPDGQTLTFEALTAPAHGWLSAVNTSTWKALYTPVHGFIGTDTFDFAAADGVTGSLPATIRIAVEAAQDSDGDGMPDEWELAHFTNALAGIAEEDNDRDGLSNLAESRANTDPNDSNSVFRITRCASAPGGFAVQWSSVGGTRYGLEYGSVLPDPAFTTLTRALSEEMDRSPKDEPSSMTVTDDFTQTPPLGPGGLRMYRVRILNE